VYFHSDVLVNCIVIILLLFILFLMSVCIHACSCVSVSTMYVRMHICLIHLCIRADSVIGHQTLVTACK
jgi:hypothetical protein